MEGFQLRSRQLTHATAAAAQATQPSQQSQTHPVHSMDNSAAVPAVTTAATPGLEYDNKRVTKLTKACTSWSLSESVCNVAAAAITAVSA